MEGVEALLAREGPSLLERRKYGKTGATPVLWAYLYKQYELGRSLLTRHPLRALDTVRCMDNAWGKWRPYRSDRTREVTRSDDAQTSWTRCACGSNCKDPCGCGGACRPVPCMGSPAFDADQLTLDTV